MNAVIHSGPYAAVAARGGERPSAPPLTHHAILGLVEPFTRRGRHLDLAASDRLQRRLVFKPIDHPADTATGLPALRETLRLDCPATQQFVLTRRLTLPDGLEASLQAAGPRPGELLARIESVAVQRQLRRSGDAVVAFDHRLAAAGGPATPDGVALTLTGGAARVDGLELTLRVPAVGGIAADVAVLAAADDPIELPEDLFAVLGGEWARLGRNSQGWRGSLRLPGREPARSRAAEQRLALAAQHLARTLAEPPARFHDRQVGARWRVALRRAVPLLACVGLIGGALCVPLLQLPPGSVFRMLIFNAPPLLLGLFFALGEMPRIELPPLPRRSRAAAWRAPAVAKG